MLILTLVQSRTHVDTVQNVLHGLNNSNTFAEVTRWRYLVHMSHLWEEIH